MIAPPGLWFVSRSHSAGALSQRVRRLAAPSLVAWFQAKVEEARISLTPASVHEADLGGDARGFGGLFATVKERSLHTPKTTAALAKLLREHLHVTGGPEGVRIDAHSLRVLTRDGEGSLAYYFFDDEAVTKNPRATVLLEEGPLPEGAAEVDPFEVPKVEKAPKVEKVPSEPKAEKAPAQPKAPRGPSKAEQAWRVALRGRDEASAPEYRPGERYADGALVSHAQFGVGVVSRADATKCEVMFRDGPRVVHRAAG